MAIHFDMSDTEYHRRSELSSTQARRLLESPAKFKHWEDQEDNTASFDLGKAVHTRVLGVGARAVAYPDDVLASNGAASTKAAKEWAEAARADGLIPMKAADLAPIEAMAEAVLAHADARPILEGTPHRETSIITTVDAVPVRARFDIYGPKAGDLKTAVDASPDGFNRAVAKYSLHVQEAWYRDAHRTETGTELDAFTFLVIEKTAPYLVGVYDLDVVWRDIGREQAKKAREMWLRCTETNTWPGYETQTLSCPPYILFDHETRYENQEIQV